MLNKAHSNISYGYSKNTTNILINNKKNYAYSSEITLVRPFLNNSMLCINHIYPIFALYSCVLPFRLLKMSPHDEHAQGCRMKEGVMSNLKISYYY